MKQQRLGITGCIGSGKSVVSAILRILNIPIYDSDSEAKRLMHSNPCIRRELKEEFGTECYPDGKNLDRKHLAEIIFNNPDALRRVNHIVHPRVKQDFEKWCKDHHCPIVGIESAILYEAGLEQSVDHVIVVDANIETCITRATTRSKATREEIAKRLKSQSSIQVTAKKAAYTIHNDNNIALLPQIARILVNIKNKPH